MLVGSDDVVGPPGTPGDGGAVRVTPQPEPPSACADAGTTVIYTITSSPSSDHLLAYDPPSNSFSLIGSIQCPGTDPRDSPFSMAVDQTGTAYTVFNSGGLFELHPSASGVTCVQVGSVIASGGVNSTFGMGFSEDAVGGGESLYIAGSLQPYELARVGVPGFAVQPIAALAPTLFHPELTGTGAGDLFAFSGADCALSSMCTPGPEQGDCEQCSTSAIAQIDKTTAKVTGFDVLEDLPLGSGWAFAFWGGQFYIFTAPTSVAMGSIVTRFDPTTGALQRIQSYPEVIVGAGVSTCAPLVAP